MKKNLHQKHEKGEKERLGEDTSPYRIRSRNVLCKGLRRWVGSGTLGRFDCVTLTVAGRDERPLSSASD